MTIHEIVHNPNQSIKNATVTLNYEEIRDIANLLCEIDKIRQLSKTEAKLHRDMFFLFEVVKNGCIDSLTVEHLGKLQDKMEDIDG